MPARAINIVAAKAEAIKKKITDGSGRPVREWRVSGQPGLVLITRPSGGGAFYLFYRPRAGGKQKKYRLGEFGALTLADATKAALEARLRIEQGGDPATDRSNMRAAMTFQELAQRFLAEAPLATTTRRTYQWALNRDAYPAIGSKPAGSVTSDDIFTVCQKIKARGKQVQAQRTKTTIGGVYSWGIREGYVKSNPAKDVPNQQGIESKRERVPLDDELKIVWHAPDKCRMSIHVKLIIRLAILTGQRRSEIAGSRVNELVGLDTDCPTWIIPASVKKAGSIIQEGRMKNKSEQRVYLSRQAAELFAEAIAKCGDGTHVFPAQTDGVKDRKTRLPHIHGESVTKAVARIRKAEGIKDLTIHDMRRAITTYLGDRDDISERVMAEILHHKPRDVTGKYYDRAKREAQLRKAWQVWADYVVSAVDSAS